VDLLQKLKTEETNQNGNVTNAISAPELDIDFMRLALHILSSAAFGIPMSYFSKAKPEDRKDIQDVLELFIEGNPPPGFKFTYTESLNFISFNVLPHLLVNGLPSWFPNLTKTMQKHRWVHADYTKYLKALVSMSKESKDSTKDNILSMMGTNTGNNAGLTEAEIRGNLFTFGLAGHETTARTLNFALVEIAMNQEVQEMLQRNIDEVMQGKPEDPREWVYEDVFPKLKMALFVMVRYSSCFTTFAMKD
jgi:cytochrome P450